MPSTSILTAVAAAFVLVTSSRVACAQPLACQPNSQQPMLPVFHTIGNVTQAPSGDITLEPINDASGVTFYGGLYHVWHQARPTSTLPDNCLLVLWVLLTVLELFSPLPQLNVAMCSSMTSVAKTTGTISSPRTWPTGSAYLRPSNQSHLRRGMVAFQFSPPLMADL